MVKITKVSETPKWASSSESSEIFTILAPNNETKSRWRIDDASYVHFKMRASAYRRYRNSETEQQLRYPASSHISKSKCCNSLITSPYCPILVGISKFKVIRINSFVHILYACLQHVRQVCHYEWKSARTHAHTHTHPQRRQRHADGNDTIDIYIIPKHEQWTTSVLFKLWRQWRRMEWPRKWQSQLTLMNYFHKE